MDDFASYDMTALAGLVSTGKVTADELLDTALSRMEAVNPALNAVVLNYEDVARRKISAGLPDGPFHGVPFLLKDLGAEAIDYPSNDGSRLMMNSRYPADSAIYARIAATGVVVFGRTATPESGIGVATEAVLYGGPTRNPWELARTPGGSSGGSGAAVAAGIVPGAHGSDGGGSVRIPASCCGLFGFKSTRARLPDGPFAGEGWAGMSIDGFLTRSVRDSAVLLDACAGADPGAPYVAPPMARTHLEAIDMAPGKLRIALCETTMSGAAIADEVAEAARDVARLLEDLGHIVETARPDADHTGMMAAWTKIVACGTALAVRKRLSALGRELRDDDVEGVTRGAIAYAATISGDQYLESVGTIHRYGRQMAAFFAQGFDVLLTPTLAEIPARIGRFSHARDDYVGYRMGPDGCFEYSPYTAAFNASGQPAMSVPLAWSSGGLPIGMHFAAAYGADEVLMALAGDLERARPWFERRPSL